MPAIPLHRRNVRGDIDALATYFGPRSGPGAGGDDVALDGSNQASWVPNPAGDATQDITGHFNLAGTYSYKINGVDINNCIILFSGSSAIYANNDTGMAAAIAAASSGDTIWLSPCVLTGNYTIPAGVTVVGKSIEDCMFTGQVTLSDGAIGANFAVELSADSGADIVGIVGSASGTAILNNVKIEVSQAGAGDACGIQGAAGDIMGWNCDISAISVGGDGYAVLPGAGQITLESGIVYGSTTALGDAVEGADWVAGAEISTGAITVTSSAGATVSGLVVGNKYSIEAYNGPWDRGTHYDPEYTYRLSNDGGASWSAGYLGMENNGTLRLNAPAWVDKAEEVDTYYARCYFVASTTSIAIRVGEDGEWHDNTGTLSWRLSSATFTVGTSAVQVHAVAGGQDGTPLLGDRAARDVIDFPDLHATDIAAGQHLRHLPIPTIEGNVAQVIDNDGTLIWSEQEILSDAENITYTPDVLSDWDGDADPGNVDGALDQLAERVDDVENIAVHTHAFQEDKSAGCNGVTVAFSTTYVFASGTTMVFLNGLLQCPGVGNDYTEDAGETGITFVTAPLAGDLLLIAYVRASGGAAITTPVDIYIDDDGDDDTGDGTVGNPYATMVKALSLLPDDIRSSATIHVADGTYAEGIDIRRFRCQDPVLLKITGNTTTPANVEFTGLAVGTIGAAVYGKVNVEFEGIEINVTATVGISVFSHAYLVIDRCIVTGTISESCITVIEHSTLRIYGDVTLSGCGYRSLNVGNFGNCGLKSGTLTIIGDGANTEAIYIGYKGQMVCGWVTGIHIVIQEVKKGIVACLGSIFQHYAATGSITIDNTSTPANSVACESADSSSFSTNQAITIDHFTTGFHAWCVAYLEAIGSRTLTNVGTASSYSLGGVIYLP